MDAVELFVRLQTGLVLNQRRRYLSVLFFLGLCHEEVGRRAVAVDRGWACLLYTSGLNRRHLGRVVLNRHLQSSSQSMNRIFSAAVFHTLPCSSSTMPVVTGTAPLSNSSNVLPHVWNHATNSSSRHPSLVRSYTWAIHLRQFGTGGFPRKGPPSCHGRNCWIFSSSPFGCRQTTWRGPQHRPSRAAVPPPHQRPQCRSPEGSAAPLPCPQAWRIWWTRPPLCTPRL